MFTLPEEGCSSLSNTCSRVDCMYIVYTINLCNDINCKKCEKLCDCMIIIRKHSMGSSQSHFDQFTFPDPTEPNTVRSGLACIQMYYLIWMLLKFLKHSAWLSSWYLCEFNADVLKYWSVAPGCGHIFNKDKWFHTVICRVKLDYEPENIILV